MKFDAQRAYHYIAQLAFPRAAGSAGESKARAYIVKQLTQLGLSVEQEAFDFTLFPAEVLPRLISAAYTVGVIGVCWLSGNRPIGASLLCVGMLVIALSLTRWQKRLEWLYNVGRAHTSKNIVATSTPSIGANFDFIFVAHYDSKSQVLSIAVRALCYYVAVVGLIGLTLLMLIQMSPLKVTLSLPLIWLIGVSICLCLLLLQFNFTQNGSPGAFDNASGVGVLLELARCLAAQSLTNKVRLTFLSPGAEEYGMCGALRYIQRHAETYHPDRTYVINLDSLGASGKLTLITRYGIPPVATSRSLGQAIIAYGREIGVEVSEIYSLTGVGFDQIPIASRGFEAVTLSSGGFGGAALKIHSKRDRIDLIHEDSLQQVGDVLVHCVEREYKMHRCRSESTKGHSNAKSHGSNHGRHPRRWMQSPYGAEQGVDAFGK